MNVTSRKRFFSDYYDSINQRAYPIISGELDSNDLYRGRLRLDSFVSESLVLVDTQVLDGELFIDLGPEALRKLLARSEDEAMPVEIRSRAETLENSLLAFFRRPEKQKCLPFSISLLRDDATRTAVMERLSATDSGKLNSYRDILEILSATGVPTSEIERIEGGWRRWFEAEGRGLVVVRQWEGNWDLDSFLGGIKAIGPCLQTQCGTELAHWTWDNRWNRSAIDAKLNAVSVECTRDDELQDIRRILSWFNSGYNRNVSNQHGCDTFESVAVSPTFLHEFDARNPEYEAAQCACVELPKGFLQRLGSMPSSSLQQFYWNQHDNLRAWWNKGDTEALKKSANALTTMILEVKTPSQALAPRLVPPAAGALLGGAVGTVGGPLGQIVGGALGAMVPEAFVWWEEKLAAKPLARTVQRIVQIAEERGHQDESGDS